jgi:hypothetical protein
VLLLVVLLMAMLELQAAVALPAEVVFLAAWAVVE